MIICLHFLHKSLKHYLILDEEIELLKWLGLYEQKPKDGYFLFRVRIRN